MSRVPDSSPSMNKPLSFSSHTLGIGPQSRRWAAHHHLHYRLNHPAPSIHGELFFHWSLVPKGWGPLTCIMNFVTERYLGIWDIFWDHSPKVKVFSNYRLYTHCLNAEKTYMIKNENINWFHKKWHFFVQSIECVLSLCFKFLMRNGVFPAISVNKYVTVISDTCPQKCKFLSPRHNQEGEQYLPNMAAIRLQPLPMVSTEELKL